MRLQLQQAKNNNILAPAEHRIAPVERLQLMPRVATVEPGTAALDPLVEPVEDTVARKMPYCFRGFRDLDWIQESFNGVKYLKNQIAQM